MIESLDQLVEQYLALESLETTEILLELCGSTIDKRALPVLKRRLHEEEGLIHVLQVRGYLRLREKSEQTVAALIALIAALEAQDREESNR